MKICRFYYFHPFIGHGDICTKIITITNPLLAPLIFSVSTEGSFVIKANGPLSGISIDDMSNIKSTTQTNKMINNNNQNNINSKKNQISTQKQKQNNQIESADPFRANKNNLMSSSAPFPEMGLNSGIMVQGPFQGPSSSVGRIFNLLPQVR